MLIKNCPFCGAAAQLTENQPPPPNEFVSAYTFQFVECIDCHARSKSYRKKSFIEVSQYTVQELRKNPELRSEIQKKLHSIIHSNNLLIISEWNRRADA